MGGNAFDKAERLTAGEYSALYETLCDWYPGCRQLVPYSVGEKITFGDFDILYHNPEFPALFMEKFNPVACIKNNNGYNLLIEWFGKLVQVDLNKSGDSPNFAFWYFSYNDLGNLIGRIAHRQGLKFGHDGLWYIHRDGTQVLDEIRLTENIGEALTHLGWDEEALDEYFGGFQTFQQMFEWVLKSKYFEPSAFPLEHRNHQARVRDSKRKVYNDFLQFLNFNGEYVEKSFSLARHFAAFPKLLARVTAADVRQAKAILWKKTFGGNVVMEMTGLEGKELGALMKLVREHFPVEDVYEHDWDEFYDFVMTEVNGPTMI